VPDFRGCDLTSGSKSVCSEAMSVGGHPKESSEPMGSNRLGTQLRCGPISTGSLPPILVK
jgi:hypothetical protein